MHKGTVISIQEHTKTEDIMCVIKPMRAFLGKHGQSVSCDGICLTLLGNVLSGEDLSMHISQETYQKTTISQWHKGRKVHLEKALCMGEDIGGHLVTGHIDGMARLENKKQIYGSEVWDLSYPPSLFPFIAPKGSVSLNGVSLTVNDVKKDLFSVNIISHTLEETCFGSIKVLESLNLEIDGFSRHIVHALSTRRKSNAFI